MQILKISKGNIKPSFRNDIAFFVLPRKVSHLIQHIFYENAVSRCRIVDQHVGHRADKLAVLDDRRAAHECGQ